MSAEQSTLVAVRVDSRVAQLAADLVSAAGRALKSDPGDRADVMRYEAMAVQLEELALRALGDGAPSIPVRTSETDDLGLAFAAQNLTDPIGSPLLDRLPETERSTARQWVDAGDLVILLRLALLPGETTRLGDDRTAPEPEDVWEAPDNAQGRKAAQARFRSQLTEACTPHGAETRLAVNPSGIHNRVLTEVLREFVDGDAISRRDAPVVYRDGSQAANAFPLKCLPLRDAAAPADLTLHLALLSIRHTEMDPVVDGAWLRNAEVSRPRPAAQTDDFVYDTSRRQLAQLTASGGRRAELHIYQTGLDTAIVGFYRAVVMHLLDYPRSLAVIPMFYTRSSGGATPLETEIRYEPGDAWSMEGRA